MYGVWYSTVNTGAVTTDIIYYINMWRQMTTENNAKNKKNVKIQCIQAYIGFIINITFAVYALFKSVNLFKYYKQKKL